MQSFELVVSSAAPENRFSVMLAYAMKFLDDLVHQAGGVDALVVQVHALYDTYIAPYDIPGVPEFIEKTFVDSSAKRAIEYALRAAHDAIHSGE